MLAQHHAVELPPPPLNLMYYISSIQALRGNLAEACPPPQVALNQQCVGGRFWCLLCRLGIDPAVLISQINQTTGVELTKPVDSFVDGLANRYVQLVADSLNPSARCAFGC